MGLKGGKYGARGGEYGLEGGGEMGPLEGVNILLEGGKYITGGG